MNKTMNKTIGRKDVIWSYIGQIVNYGVHILLTPIISVRLSSYELGLWYTFTSIFTLVNFFDTGFSPLIMRNAAYCAGGAQVLLKEGIKGNDKFEGGECNYGLLKTLYRTSRKLYGVMALLFMGVLLTAGTSYIRYVTREDFHELFILAWIIYVCGIAVNIFMIFLPAYLKGLGSIEAVQKIYAVGRGTQLFLSILGVFGGFGIVALAFSFLIGNLIICLASYYIYAIRWKKIIFNFPDRMSQKEVLKILMFNAKKLGLVAIGRYLTTQGNILICSTFLSLETSARYGLTIQALQAVSSVGMIYLQAVVPTISVFKVEGNKEKEKKYFSMAMVTYWVMYIGASVVVYLLANRILGALDANTKLLEGGLLIFAIAIFFLQYNQICFSLYIGMENKVPYMKGEFISGILVVFLAYLLIKHTSFGVMGILIAQCFVQLSYNDWKWPYEVCRQLKMSIWDIWILGVRNIRLTIKQMVRKSENML